MGQQRRRARHPQRHGHRADRSDDRSVPPIASVSPVIAGFAAEGGTMVHRVYHLDRGFENLEQKLGTCGALVERVSDQE